MLNPGLYQETHWRFAIAFVATDGTPRDMSGREWLAKMYASDGSVAFIWRQTGALTTEGLIDVTDEATGIIVLDAALSRHDDVVPGPYSWTLYDVTSSADPIYMANGRAVVGGPGGSRTLFQLIEIFDDDIIGEVVTGFGITKLSQIDIPNVRDWSVRGDNSNDDRANIQRAADESLALYFPSKYNYIVDGGLTIRNGAQWYGPAGLGNTATTAVEGVPKLRFVGTATAGISNKNPAANLLYVTIHNLSMIFEGTYTWMWDFRNIIGCTFSHCRLDTASNTIGGIHSQRIAARATWVNQFTQMEVHLPQDTSIARPLDLDISDSSIIGGHFSGGLGAIMRGAGGMISAVRFDLSGPTGAGLTISHDRYSGYSQWNVVGCFIEENAQYGILVDGDAYDAHPTNAILCNITSNIFWNTGGAIANIKLLNATGAILEGPNIKGNIHSLPEGPLYVLKHVDYDRTRWAGVNFDDKHRGSVGRSQLIGSGRSAQPVLLLGQSTTLTTDATTTVGADIPLATITVPAKTLQAGDIVEVDVDWVMTSSTNNKIVRVTFGGTIYTGFVIASAGTVGASTRTRIAIVSSTSQKGLGANFAGSGSTTSARVTSTVDLDSDVNIVLSIQRATASELIGIENYKMLLHRKGVTTIPAVFPYPGTIVDIDFINLQQFWGGALKTPGDFTTYALNGSTFDGFGLAPTATVDITLALAAAGFTPPGTLVAQLYPTSIPTGAIRRPVELHDGSTNNRVSFHQVLTNGNLNPVVIASGVTQAATSTLFALNTMHGAGISFQTDDVLFSRDGITLAEDTDGATIPPLTTMQIGKGIDANTQFAGKIARILLFGAVLSQDELDDVTTTLGG